MGYNLFQRPSPAPAPAAESEFAATVVSPLVPEAMPPEPEVAQLAPVSDFPEGADNPYEAIKVIEAWKLGFCLGNTVKYISRAGKKDATLQELQKARWYLDREIQALEREAGAIGYQEEDSGND